MARFSDSRTLVKLGLWGALASAVLACSPATVRATSDASTEVSTDAPIDGIDADAIGVICRTYGRDFCSYLNGCSPTTFTSRYGADVGLCPMIYAQLCENILNAPSTAASEATYVACLKQLGPKGWACADAVENENAPAVCRPPGTMPAGSACDVSEQCASGFCGYRPGSACGTCGPPPTSCVETQCPTGASCVGGQCVFPPGVGQSCGGGLNCKVGLACVTPAVAGGTPSCQPAANEAGAPCSVNGSGVPSCNFYAGLACDGVTGKCTTPVPFGDPGQACGVVAGVDRSCSAGTCSRGVCVANVLPGGSCVLDGVPCSAGTSCIVAVDGGTSGTCKVHGSGCR